MEVDYFIQHSFQTLNILLYFMLEREGFGCGLSKNGFIKLTLLSEARLYGIFSILAVI